jgi:O-antigen/teichoic acid export membrane protein
MCALAGLIYIFLPTVVKLFIPQYIPGIDAGKIALLGITFLSVSALMQKYLIATNRQTHLLFIIAFALVLKIVLIYIFISERMGINGVAMAANIAYFVYSTFIIVFTSRYYKNNFLETIRYLIEICVPFLYLLLILFGLNRLNTLPFLKLDNEIIQLAVYFAISVTFVIIPFGFAIKNKLSVYRAPVEVLNK